MPKLRWVRKIVPAKPDEVHFAVQSRINRQWTTVKEYSGMDSGLMLEAIERDYPEAKYRHSVKWCDKHGVPEVL